MSLSDNLNKVKNEISISLKKSNRTSESLKLLAVSKTVGCDKIKEMFELGQKDFGENRPQVLRDKAKELENLPINWHFIGHLQNNKIKYVYPVATLVHSIDRRELLDEFIEWAKKTERKCPVLLEVHISREEAKQGFDVDEVLDVIKDYKDNEYLDIRGLMGMAPLDADEDKVKACFKELSSLFQKSKNLEGKAYKAEELSMGMSGDFPIAIEEGATIIRIGTALFSE